MDWVLLIISLCSDISIKIRFNVKDLKGSTPIRIKCKMAIIETKIIKWKCRNAPKL